MKRLSTLFLALSVTLVLVSCDKKKDDPTPPPPTKKDHITKSTWTFQSASAGGMDISNTPQISCYKDNSVVFNTNNTGTTAEGSTVCTSPTPSTFTWSFQNSEAVLRVEPILFAGGSPDFTLVSVDATNLVVSQSVTFSGFPPTTVTVTFKH